MHASVESKAAREATLRHTPHAVAGSAQTVASAEPPPVPPSCAYFELVEACLNDGLRFPRGGQAILFGDSPQVCSILISDAPVGE